MEEKPVEKKELSFSVRDLPIVLSEMRRELAGLLTAVAGCEPNPDFAHRLRQLAGAFEAGVSKVDALNLRTDKPKQRRQK